MLIAVDVSYNDRDGTARAVAGTFSAWNAPRLTDHFVQAFDEVEPYVPGAFYRRELPCLLAVLSQVPTPAEAILVDGHVWLGKEPGLGHHLWSALAESVPVIGVAKSRFSGGGRPLLRGGSKQPLYVSAVGMHPELARKRIIQMHGARRLPTLIEAVDVLTRGRQTPRGGPGGPQKGRRRRGRG